MDNQNQQKNKLLVIEDDQYLAEIYATKLKIEGFDTQIANDGAIGIEMAKKMLPDIILLDVLLPTMDGFEVLKQLKSNDLTKNIAVILLTNLNSPDDIEKGLQGGAIDYMVKAHFVPSEIVAKVKNILALSNTAQ